MSLTQMDDFTFKHSSQIDALYTQYTANQIKSLFDSRGVELRTFINNLVSVLAASTGAANIGNASITDLDGATVQAVLQSIRDKLKSVVDGTSGADFVNATGITGLTGTTVQSLLESLKTLADNNNTTQTNNLNTHKSSSDHDNRYYTQTQLQSITSGTSGADLIKATPISANSGNTVQSQLAWLLTQIAVAATGSIPDGSITEVKLAQTLIDKINTALSNVGVLTTLLTTNKTNAVNAINEIFNDFSNMQIGIRNLLLDSNFENGLAGFEGYDSSIVEKSADYAYDGKYSLKTVASKNDQQGIVRNLDLKNAGKTITLSMYVKGIGNSLGKNVFANIYDSGSYGVHSVQGNPIILTSEWQPISMTYTIPSGATDIRIYWLGTLSIGDIVYCDCVKLEEGNKVTGWIPAPEDITTDYVRHPGYAVTSGTSTAYTITLNPAPTSYVDGQQFTILPHVDCGNNPTINANSLGTLTMLKQDGSSVSAGDIKANNPLSGVRVGSNFFIRNSSLSNIKSTQKGNIILDVSTLSQTINIASVNINNSIVRVKSIGSTGRSSVDETSIKLLNSTQIQIDRTSNGTSVNIFWEVIEFNNVKSKQSGSSTLTQVYTTTVISSVNVNKSILFISFRSDVSSQYHLNISAVLTDSTDITFAINGSTVYVEWQLIEFN